MLFLIFKINLQKNFYLDYLSVYSSLFLLVLDNIFYITNEFNESWLGVIIRRIPEHLMSLLPIYALLFIPILFGMDFIFEWLDAEHIAQIRLFKKNYRI